jgi:DNA sulfur modification protein DndB
MERLQFFSEEDYAPVVLKHRNKAGGKVMFRPLGLEVVTKVIISLVEQGSSLSDSVKLAARLPRDLNTLPFRGLLWDSEKKLIVSAYKVTLRETLLYMLGKSTVRDEVLLGRIRKALGDDNAKLPEIIAVTSIGLESAVLKKR